MAYIYIDNLQADDMIYCNIKEECIAIDLNGSLYQQVLDAIIEDGADCFEGDIPADLQAAADTTAT